MITGVPPSPGRVGVQLRKLEVANVYVEAYRLTSFLEVIVFLNVQLQ